MRSSRHLSRKGKKRRSQLSISSSSTQQQSSLPNSIKNLRQARMSQRAQKAYQLTCQKTMIVLRRSNQQEKLLLKSLLSRRVASTSCPKCDLLSTLKWLRLYRRAWSIFYNISSRCSKKLAVKRANICTAPAAPPKPSTVCIGAR